MPFGSCYGGAPGFSLPGFPDQGPSFEEDLKVWSCFPLFLVGKHDVPALVWYHASMGQEVR